MAIERFLRMNILIDGETQVLLQNGTVNWDTKKVPVNTMSGLVGFSPGPKGVTISAESAVRVSGPEFDAFESGANDLQHEITVPYGTKSIVTEGEIMSGSITGSVESATSHSFEFMGTYNPPK